MWGVTLFRPPSDISRQRERGKYYACAIYHLPKTGRVPLEPLIPQMGCFNDRRRVSYSIRWGAQESLPAPVLMLTPSPPKQENTKVLKEVHTVKVDGEYIDFHRVFSSLPLVSGHQITPPPPPLPTEGHACTSTARTPRLARPCLARWLLPQYISSAVSFLSVPYFLVSSSSLFPQGGGEGVYRRVPLAKRTQLPAHL